MSHTPARVLVALALLLALGGCASLQRSADEGSAARVARLLAEGESAELAKMSVSPFILDAEIIPLASDVATFWDGAAKAGLRLETGVARAVPVGPETWREFGASREVQVYFTKYVAQGARLFELRTSRGGRVLLLVRERLFSFSIYGFRGPF
jgi:hypothetical protein